MSEDVYVKQKQKFPEDADSWRNSVFPMLISQEVNFIIAYKSELKYACVPHAESGHALS